MDTFRHDLRYALRTIVKSPGLTAAAVLSLGLGIGANATVFTWTMGALVRPFRGVPHQDTLFELTPYRAPDGHLSVSYPDYRDLAQSAHLSDLIVQEDVALNVDEGGRAERIWALAVSGNYFDVLGIAPAAGRVLVAGDTAIVGDRAVAVLSHAFWRRRFGGDPGVVGRIIRLNTRPFTVVGVAGPRFAGARLGLAYDVFVPLTVAEGLGAVAPGRLEDRGARWLEGLGRRRPGATLDAARAELEGLARGLAEAHPDTNRGVTIRVNTLADSPWGGARLLKPVLLVLTAVVAVVLLVACANVANLLLARATGRRREIAVRLSLGASRARIVRQLLTESLLLALAGGATGVLVTSWTAGALSAFVPANEFQFALDFDLDFRVLAFSVALSLATAILFGLAPALQATQPDLVQTLRDEAATVVGGRRARLQNALVVAQVAMSALLLVSAGLLAKSAKNARAFDPGFRPRGVLLASLDLFANGYTPERGRVFYRRLLERARAIPGAEAVTLARRVPLGFGGSSSGGVEVEGYDAGPDAPRFALYNEIGPGYMAAMRIPLVAGRDFLITDDEKAPRVAIVNETMSRWYWAGREVLGGRVRVGGEWYTVVGVASDIKQQGLGQRPLPFLFRPVLQFYRPDVTVHVRTAGDPATLAVPLAAAVAELDPTLPTFAVKTLEEHVRAASVQQRLGGTLLVAFGALALVLAAIGLYGVLAYAVGQRTREIGVRIALGGRPRDIAGLVLRQGLGLTGIGLLIGIVGGRLAALPLRALLIGVTPDDPATFALVLLVLSLTALVACFIPARRAAAVDPMAALRNG